MPTPRPAVPEAVLAVVDALAEQLGAFDRISVGFPGVVHEGVTKTAPHLDPSWSGFSLRVAAWRSGAASRRACFNDAAIQGLGVIEGHGLEAVITLGTGLGCCLYTDGKPWQLELGHHPFGKRKTYEDLVGDAARRAAGNRQWNKRVRKAIAQLEALFSYRRLYVGGGNTKFLDREGLPENVSVVDNTAGLLGGIRLWQ